jgi:hypothetical protein
MMTTNIFSIITEHKRMLTMNINEHAYNGKRQTDLLI